MQIKCDKCNKEHNVQKDTVIKICGCGFGIEVKGGKKKDAAEDVIKSTNKDLEKIDENLEAFNK